MMASSQGTTTQEKVAIVSTLQWTKRNTFTRDLAFQQPVSGVWAKIGTPTENLQ
jgi:hypothetical protein